MHMQDTLSSDVRRGDWSIWTREWDQSWAVWSQSLASAKDWSKKWNDPLFCPYGMLAAVILKLGKKVSVLAALVCNKTCGRCGDDVYRGRVVTDRRMGESNAEPQRKNAKTAGRVWGGLCEAKGQRVPGLLCAISHVSILIHDPSHTGLC